MTDRVEAAGGSIAVTASEDRTVVKVSLPVAGREATSLGSAP
jgi:hypothetical protein